MEKGIHRKGKPFVGMRFLQKKELAWRYFTDRLQMKEILLIDALVAFLGIRILFPLSEQKVSKFCLNSLGFLIFFERFFHFRF